MFPLFKDGSPSNLFAMCVIMFTPRPISWFSPSTLFFPKFRVMAPMFPKQEYGVLLRKTFAQKLRNRSIETPQRENAYLNNNITTNNYMSQATFPFPHSIPIPTRQRCHQRDGERIQMEAILFPPRRGIWSPLRISFFPRRLWTNWQGPFYQREDWFPKTVQQPYSGAPQSLWATS